MFRLKGVIYVSAGLVISILSTDADAAMCGRYCEYGGRYIPGPPEVCYERGLNFCGPSRQAPRPGIGIQIPGVGGVGVYGPPAAPSYGNCRTITIERDDGSVRRIRRCD